MISAIILAAGKSTRMGQPKMLLPWGKTTILGQVISTLQNSEIQDIFVVTGGAKDQVEAIALAHNVRTIHNDAFEWQEMLSSIQCGLKAQKDEAEGTLICLGDQPQMQKGSVLTVCEAFEKSRSSLVIPSYQMRRGHPWLVARPLWDELLKMHAPQTPRDFLQSHTTDIEYVVVDTPSVIEDIDVPGDYLKSKPPV